MDSDHAGPPEYLAAHVQQALAAEPSTAELGVRVREVGGTLVLTGTVATGDRRDLVAAVAAEAADGRQIRNDVAVAEVTAPTRVEPL
jgi:hypothetical protein